MDDIKICVFSDSHGYSKHMLRAVEKESPDCIFFLAMEHPTLPLSRNSIHSSWPTSFGATAMHIPPPRLSFGKPSPARNFSPPTAILSM